jgi:hypothetical protein
MQNIENKCNGKIIAIELAINPAFGSSLLSNIPLMAVTIVIQIRSM